MRIRTAILTLCVFALAASAVWLTAGGNGLLRVASVAADETHATARAATGAGGQEVGEVLVGGTVVLRIRTAADGMTPSQRATDIAQRLDAAIVAGLRPADVHPGTLGADAVIVVGETLLVTASAAEAQASTSTPVNLVSSWATNIAHALGGEPGETTAYEAQGGTTTPPADNTPPATNPPADNNPPATNPPADNNPPATDPPADTAPPAPVDPASNGGWTPPEPYKDKFVPILSLGQGKRIGVARVSGPASRIDVVQAVGQLETKWRGALEINVYVPISTREPGRRISRVQACSVTALGDLEF